MPRRRPNRLPRRVRRLLRLALARARRHFRHQPRPTLEQVVDTVATLEVQLERHPSARRAVTIMQDIIEDLNNTTEPPLQEAFLDTSPEVSQDNECPVCFERQNDVILNCIGRHAFCGQCPSRIYKHDAKCPLCRDYFDEITPLFGTPILNILPLENRCTIHPEHIALARRTNLWPRDFFSCLGAKCSGWEKDALSQAASPPILYKRGCLLHRLVRTCRVVELVPYYKRIE